MHPNSFLFNFILLKKLNNHINHIIKKNIFFYMLYFEFFKMILKYKTKKTLYVIF